MKGIVFSIVIPTYNRPKSLRSSLAAIADLRYPRERFEVVVVDDGSTVPLDYIVKSFHDRCNIHLLRQSNAGPAAARNRGAAHASGEYVVFTDDDCLPEETWLSAFEQRFSEQADDLLGGRTVNARPENSYSEASQQLIGYLCDRYGSGVGRSAFVASNNMAMRLELFHAVGGFDATFPLAAGEDREFCDRWQAEGLSASYVLGAIVYHAHEMDFAGFARQHFTYGRGAFHFHRARRRREGGSFFIESMTFYTGLIGYPLTFDRGARAWLQSTLLLFSQFANASGFFWERFRGSS